MDVAAVVLSSFIVVPLIAIMAMIVALDGHNPFYTQLRVGQHGRTFRIFKIRTMVHDADALLQKHLEENLASKTEWESKQKLRNDVRITRVGWLLRKTSMDELPQLLNVLLGDMSLVGPRPMMPSQKEMYTGTSYYRLRPGITGFWQISDRNLCGFQDRAEHDTFYELEMSFVTDLNVLWRTVAVVLRGTGY
ncbi:MAG: sugar transferase [Tateyamaria sp.]